MCVVKLPLAESMARTSVSPKKHKESQISLLHIYSLAMVMAQTDEKIKF